MHSELLLILLVEKVQCPVPIGLDLAAPTQLIPRRRLRLAPLAHDFRLSFPLTGCFAILFFFF